MYKEFIIAAGIRAVRTMAQTAVAMLPAAASITDVGWTTVLGVSALAGVASILTSIATGLPEIDDSVPIIRTVSAAKQEAVDPDATAELTIGKHSGDNHGDA